MHQKSIQKYQESVYLLKINSMFYIINLLVTAAVALLLSRVLPGISINSFGTAVIFAFVLSLLGIFVKPVLQIIGFPITVLTLGLFSLVINGLVIMLAAYLISDMSVDGLGYAILFSVCLALVS